MIQYVEDGHAVTQKYSTFVFRNRTPGQTSEMYEFTVIDQNLTQKSHFWNKFGFGIVFS